MSERLLETARMVAAKGEFLARINEWNFEEENPATSRAFVASLVSDLLRQIPHYNGIWQHISIDDLPTELSLFIPSYYKEIRISLNNAGSLGFVTEGYHGNHISLEPEHFGKWGLDFMIDNEETRVSVYGDRFSTEDATRFVLTRGNDEEYLLTSCISLCRSMLLKDRYLNSNQDSL